MGKNTKINNKGLSLVELVIVMAIISILAGLVTWGVGMAANKPADQCARQLKIMLERHRSTSMGKNVAKMTIYKDASGYIMVQEYFGDESGNLVAKPPQQIGDKGVVVKVNINGSWTELSNTGWDIVFDRASGSLKKNGSYYYSEYSISKGTINKTVTITPITGKVSID